MNPDESASGDSTASTRAPIADQSDQPDPAQLLTRVRHEINNPLAALLGQAQLLLRDELSESVRRRVETIESLAIRIKEIVAELRTGQ
jgi:signal transduction histidine kinase